MDSIKTAFVVLSYSSNFLSFSCFSLEIVRAGSPLELFRDIHISSLTYHRNDCLLSIKNLLRGFQRSYSSVKYILQTVKSNTIIS